MSTPDLTHPADLLRGPANRVSSRAVIYWFARALIGWLLVIAIEVIAWALDWPVPPWHGPVLFVTAGVAAVHLAVMPRWRYRVHRWELAADAVYTRSGWWTQEWRIAPVSRIQTVDSERGPLEQIFRLSNVTVTTASAAGPIKIHGLDRDTAQRLVDELTEGTQAERGDAT
jgi:uncharacterized protein